MVFDVIFIKIIGYGGNPSYIFEHEISSAIESISQSLADISVEHSSHVLDVADIIFGSDYGDVDLDCFELKDRLSLFHSFMNSKHGHLLDTENRDSLLYVYHMIYNSLRSMDIEPEATKSPFYLASFAQAFRDLDDNDLKNLCSTITNIYDSEAYSDLKGSHDCSDWELLAEQIRTLDSKRRETLSDLLSWLPNTFNFAPADAVKEFKNIDLLEKIDTLESFEEVGTLAKQAFQIHDDQYHQLESLDQIITSLINNVPYNEIMEDIRTN